jgi:hypothetical protein
MPTIHLEPPVSPDDLLRAADQLAPAELERFASQVFALVAHRRAPSLSHDETELLLAINEGIPPEAGARYAALIARRREGSLTPDEVGELVRLGDGVEVMDARRAEHLAKLARLRGVSLDEVMASLGLRAPEEDE